MKATITSEGILAVSSETELECYALSKWVKENFVDGKLDPVALTINCAIIVLDKENNISKHLASYIEEKRIENKKQSLDYDYSHEIISREQHVDLMIELEQ